MNQRAGLESIGARSGMTGTRGNIIRGVITRVIEIERDNNARVATQVHLRSCLKYRHFEKSQRRPTTKGGYRCLGTCFLSLSPRLFLK